MHHLNMRAKMFFIALIAVSAGLLARQNSDGNVAAGETVFFGKGNCSSCHEVNGRGGIVGPDLSGAGTRSPEALRAKIVNPTAATGGRRGGAPQVIVVKVPTAARSTAFAATKNVLVQMVDASGKLHVLDKSKLAEMRREASLMPEDYASRLTAVELESRRLSSRRSKGATSRDISRRIPGGLTYERLRNAKAEPQNWLITGVIIRARTFPGSIRLLRRNSQGFQAKWTAPLPRPELSRPAARRRRRHVRDGARNRRRARRQDRPTDLDLHTSGKLAIRTRSIPPIAAWPCWETDSSSAPWMPRW